MARALLAPLAVDFGGLLAREAVDGGYRGYEVFWFFDALGESRSNSPK